MLLELSGLLVLVSLLLFVLVSAAGEGRGGTKSEATDGRDGMGNEVEDDNIQGCTGLCMIGCPSLNNRIGNNFKLLLLLF